MLADSMRRTNCYLYTKYAILSAFDEGPENRVKQMNLKIRPDYSVLSAPPSARIDAPLMAADNGLAR